MARLVKGNNLLRAADNGRPSRVPCRLNLPGIHRVRKCGIGPGLCCPVLTEICARVWMRADMAKVIVERPRRKGYAWNKPKGYQRRLRRQGDEGAVRREGIKLRWQG